MPQLAVPLSELWVSGSAVSRGEFAGIHYASDGHWMMGSVVLPGTPEADFEATIADTYVRISRCTEEAGCPYLLRFWNFIGDIHRRYGQWDRYQLFCRARHRPLLAHTTRMRDGFPAATAIGYAGAGSAIYFLAGAHPGHHQENPRQTSAYEYPPEYGPQSPSFARATLAADNGNAALYVSGTASIVGHESRHRDDVAAQFSEVLANVDHVIAATGRATGRGFSGSRDIRATKIYLRRAADLAAVQPLLQSVLGDRPVMFLQGDLCRQELLLEIEAFAQCA